MIYKRDSPRHLVQDGEQVGGAADDGIGVEEDALDGPRRVAGPAAQRHAAKHHARQLQLEPGRGVCGEYKERHRRPFLNALAQQLGGLAEHERVGAVQEDEHHGVRVVAVGRHGRVQLGRRQGRRGGQPRQGA
jgi:hypothetical protein